MYQVICDTIKLYQTCQEALASAYKQTYLQHILQGVLGQPFLHLLAKSAKAKQATSGFLKKNPVYRPVFELTCM